MPAGAVRLDLPRPAGVRVFSGLARGRVAWLLLSVLWCCHTHAQLRPDRVYYGVNRAMPMRVDMPPSVSPPVPERVPAPPPGQAPPGDAASTLIPPPAGREVRIDLFECGSVEPVASAPALAGPVDLAALFPVLWTGATPKVRYAQLSISGEQVGPAVVLQPMVSPAMAYLVEPRSRKIWWTDPTTKAPPFEASSAKIEWVGEPPTVSGIRAYVEQHVVLHTTLGTIEFRLRPDVAPNTVWTFRDLVGGGFYTKTIVHRVVNKLPGGAPFVIQAGDPTGTGNGGPGFATDLEPSTLAHDFGVLSMARGTEPNTNGSQFFIALSREGTKQLDGRYTSFGECVAGAETIQAIARVAVNGQRPTEPPMIESASLVDAPVWNKRPLTARRPDDKPAAR
jgi:peptidyl-prolyl cis-trans isomerase B (cyclophilin B)